MHDINEINSLKEDIINELLNSKARDVLVIDLQDKNDVCDYMIIVSGTSDRHVKSIADKLIYYLKHYKDRTIHYSSEGLSEGKWVLVDTPSIITHIFQPEMREFYNLEKLWGDEDNMKKLSTDDPILSKKSY